MVKNKKKLKYYANLMYNMQQDTLWDVIMETAQNYKSESDIPDEVDLTENAGINFALEKYKHALIDIGESIMDDECGESNEEDGSEKMSESETENETGDEETDEEPTDGQTGAGRLPFYRTKGYSLGLKKSYH